MRQNVAIIAEFMQMRNILTPLCGYTSSASVGHLLLKEKACGCGAKLKDKLQFGGQRPLATSGLNGWHFSLHHRPVRRCDAVNSSLSLSSAPHPKPPLCKGRWAKSLISLGGVVAASSNEFALVFGENATSTAQSPSQKSEISDSPLYTRGPWVRCKTER